MRLEGRRVVLGVSGAISAYKALELARLLVKEGVEVRPVMTRSAAEFITPLSLSTLALNPVSTSLFSADDGCGISHIELAETAEIIICAPATANLIGKLASGMADDLLTTLITAAASPVLIAPSMNTRMWENPIVAANVDRLRAAGYVFAGPSEGPLACGSEGRGRLASPEEIMEAARETLTKKDLATEKVLVSAGPTREAMDPVRFVSSASSGRMGYAIARAAKRRGAEVVLVSGPSCLPHPTGVTLVGVETAAQMEEACMRRYAQSTIVIMAAAIADYRPVTTSSTKLKKRDGPLTVKMERTADVLKEMGAKKKTGQILVGFALETEDIEKNAQAKLKDKNLDLVVGNGPAGFESETNGVTIIGHAGEAETMASVPKDEIAERILDHVVKLRCDGI